jgi:hypothetical protein
MATTTIAATIIKETAKAYYANVDGCHTSAWLPKSQLMNVRVTVHAYDDGETALFLDAEIPVWLWNKLPINTDQPIRATKPW